MAAVPVQLYHPNGGKIGLCNMVPPAPPSSMETLAREVAIALGVEDENNRFEPLFTGPLKNLEEGGQLLSDGTPPWMTRLRVGSDFVSSLCSLRSGTACAGSRKRRPESLR